MTRKVLLILATVAALAGAAVGGAAIAGAFDGDDERVLPITVGEATPQGMAEAKLTVEDGIARGRAVALAKAATDRVPGQALTVEAEDRDFEVGVRNREGRIVEVLLDGQNRVISIDESD